MIYNMEVTDHRISMPRQIVKTRNERKKPQKKAVPETFNIIMEEDWESWANIIKACVHLSSTPLSLNEINRDVKMVQGRDIPYSQLNFKSLEEMINNIAGLKVTKLNGILTVVKTTVLDRTYRFLIFISRTMQHVKPSFKKKRGALLCALVMCYFIFSDILLLTFDAPKVFNIAKYDHISMGRYSKCPALKAPAIPSVGSVFEVHILSMTDPENFIVQPFNNIYELDILMKELSRFCESYSGPPITPDSLKIGNMYAAKYDESGLWYRVHVFKIINKALCVVYFCDYGEYRVVSLNQLRPLENNFYDLPYQAIKAEFIGNMPDTTSSWTIKDLLRLNELIIIKNFVSTIKSYSMENSSSEEMILDLELIDSSNSEGSSSYFILFRENSGYNKYY